MKGFLFFMSELTCLIGNLLLMSKNVDLYSSIKMVHITPLEAVQNI